MATKTPEISNISRFRVQFPIEKSNGSYEAILGPDMVEPDNSMSIPEIIAKYTRGQGLQVLQHPWVSGSAPEDGYSVNDADEEAFLEDSIYQNPASETSDPAPQDPVPEEPEIGPDKS